VIILIVLLLISFSAY
ncbi:type I toxin-antitoxin system Ibs family toxin, partial [Escherichia coli]